MDTLTARFNCCFDPGAPVVYFPIRHHSPACSLHLGRLLEEYRPACILIEGPADTNHLLEHAAAGDTTAPVCIYYSSLHKVKNDEGENEERRSACYYPLLDFSPELVAIRHGFAHAIPTRFIDLPYSELALLERGERGGDEGKNTYYSDYYLARSAYIESLCKKQGCRDYGELWEKLFEIGGLSMDTAAFIRSMLALCHFSRVDYPPELLEEEGCLAREAHMAAEIAAAKADYPRVLVVTGGFHTAALAALLEGTPQKPALSGGKGDSYLIPYSMAESDQLAGYASGMPFPAFYQRVFETLAKRPDTAFDDAVLRFLVQIGGALRAQKESTSIADEIAALAQSRGLAALREKPQQGVYELLDAVNSAYIKEQSGSAPGIARTVTRLLRGDRMGTVSAGVQQIPLLLDFQKQSARHRLKTGSAMRQEITLEILAKPAHREASAFFHRLAFLGTGFGEKLFGPDYRSRDTSRVREKWRYGASAKVQSNLVDVSYLGGTVREAASTLLGRRRESDTGCGDCTQLLIDAAVMDLTEHIAPLLDRTREAVALDGSFPSLSAAAENLLFLESAKWLLNLPDDAVPADLLPGVYNKAASLVSSLATKDEGEDRALAGSLKGLYQISRRAGIDPEPLTEALRDLAGRDAPPPSLHGAAVGLLYADGRLEPDEALQHAQAYLFGTGEQVKKSGRFLGGLFLSAWDILFSGSGFLEGLSQVLSALPQDEFLTILPDLRLAFSTFTPSQIDRVGAAVAKLLGVTKQAVAAAAVPEQVLRLGRALDGYAREHIAKQEVGA